MKTTVEISDALLDEAKRLAAREHTTVRAFIEQGLRHVLAQRKRPSEFKLRKASFKGRGLGPGAPTTWDGVREAIDDERGG